MMIERINTEPWANGKWGNLDYWTESIVLRFDEMDEGCMHRLYAPRERNADNYPIVAEGMVAYLNYFWGKYNTMQMFNGYMNECKQKYIQVESMRPDAYKRNLESEFLSIHFSDEKLKIERSKKVFEFLTKEKVGAILEYVEGYIDYISNLLGLPSDSNLNEKTHSNSFIALVCIYTGKEITKENALEVLTSFGKKGRINKLLEVYNDLYWDRERTNSNELPKSDLFRLKQLKEVIKHLNSIGADTAKADTELAKLKKACL